MIHPKERSDLMLAPVAVEIDLNLQAVRPLSVREIEDEMQLKLDRPLIDDTRAERAQRVLEIAIRQVDMHGWSGEITADDFALHLAGGSVSLDLALSPTLLEYIKVGPAGS